MRKYYFFDRGILQPQMMYNFDVQVTKGVKDESNNPMFREDFFSNPPRRWEARYDNGYPNVIYDPNEKLYRLYYTLCVKDDFSTSTPLEERKEKCYIPQSSRITATAYAQSKDGIHWEKPSLGLCEFEGSKDNNLIMLYAHGTGIMYDEQELDSSKRYKMITRVDYPGTAGYMAVSFSADGIHWDDLIRWPKHNPQADSHNFVFRDPTDRLYKLITRIWKDGLRISAICESADFIHWSEPKEILRGSGFARQVYSMPVFRRGELFLGLASIFHEGDQDAENFDLVDLELTYAHNADSFDFVAPNKHLIERGPGRYPKGAFDNSCIYAAPPVNVDGKTYIYYMGGNGPHTNFRETSFGRACFEEDKWASLTPNHPERTAQAVTIPFHFYGEKFEVLSSGVDDPGFEVALYGFFKDEEPLEGFGFEDAQFKKAEDGYWRVSFNKPFLSLETKNPCIFIRTKGVSLYALRGELEQNSGRYR